jgi:flagellar hook-basal body complex protein FliE
MRAMVEAAQGAHAVNPQSQAGTSDFAAVLKSSIDKVNDAQQQAGQMAAAFEAGDPRATLPEVMIAMQKASLSFQSMTEVRNKLIHAYQDIMNMPI